ncbi:MAG: hypothetical protein JEZ11_08855 [Desulfobacterales bacterium]|nr:hypothetical protein [Desulfobacterales bacterium]
MKHRWFVAAILGALLSGCGTHGYRIDGNDLTLILRKPQAQSVVLVSSLDGFSPRPAKNVAGCWEVTLPAGKAFKYFYRVDGVVFLPDCPLRENDDFGDETCIFDPLL